MTLAYLGANFNFIQHNYGLFTSIDPFNNVQVATFTGPPQPARHSTRTPSYSPLPPSGWASAL